MPIRQTIIEDLKAVKVEADDNVSNFILFKHLIYCLIFFPNFACVFFYRVNRYLHVRRLPFRKLLSVWRFYKFSNDISASASVGPGLRLVHLTDVVIGSEVIIGRNANIFNGVTIGAKAINGDVRMPVIGDNVFIGTGAKIIGDIEIGSNVIIGALTYCSKSVPSNTVVHGSPVRMIENQKIYNNPCWKYYWEKEI